MCYWGRMFRLKWLPSAVLMLVASHWPARAPAQSIVAGGEARNRMAGYGFEQGSPPVGIGYKWQARVSERLRTISGHTIFGHGHPGALRGTLCFVPTDTRRLVSIERCRPEGLLYADGFEASRQYFSGFPGITARYTWFALDYSGSFKVSLAGAHRFRLRTQDASILWVDGRQVVNNDAPGGEHHGTGAIDLAPGKHRIRVMYLMGARSLATFQLFVTLPGRAEQVWQARL